MNKITEEDADYPDIAVNPIDETEYKLVSTSPHYGLEWERLSFKHRVTGQMVFRRRITAQRK